MRLRFMRELLLHWLIRVRVELPDDLAVHFLRGADWLVLIDWFRHEQGILPFRQTQFRLLQSLFHHPHLELRVYRRLVAITILSIHHATASFQKFIALGILEPQLLQPLLQLPELLLHLLVLLTL